MSPRPEKRQSLRAKFLRVTIPLIFLSVIGVFSLIELMAHRSAVVLLEQTLDGMIRTQAAALANPVWNLDRAQVQLSLQAIVSNREILSAQVLGEKGDVMGKAGMIPDDTPAGELIPLSREIAFNAGTGPRAIGTLDFVATRQFVWDQTRNRLLIAALIALVAVSIEVAAAVYALGTIIGQPLTRLLASINRARSGESRAPVNWQSTDELGQVIAAYNEMQAQQQGYEAELRTARDSLEERVQDRTAELAAKTTQLERLSRQLAKYLSPQVYESIFAGRQEVKIAAQRKKLTVFFSDIADFTETTDRLESEELTQLLNHYLTEMSRIALEYGATIDKYVGDAVVIFFGDPETRGVREDARACVRMALAMRRRMGELEEVWRAAGIARPLRCRMGIHTDFCTVGNFGSEDRLDYTIIGGGVNLAARLEAACAPGDILISYESHAHVKDVIRCEEQGYIEVKGISRSVATFCVVDLYENLASADQTIRTRLPHFQLDADPASMSDEEQRKAKAALLDAAKRIRTVKVKTSPDGA